MRNYTIGCDPEMFVKDRHTGQFVSAHAMIPGNKQRPFPLPQGGMQVDGMALEVNTHPATTRAQFLDNIRGVMAELQMALPPMVEIAHGVPFADFGADIYHQPPEAVELGCEPDFNGWTGDINPRPGADDITFRTAAGHIHIGWGANVESPYEDAEHFQRCCEMAQQMDYYVGIYSLLWDGDNRRRSLYGKAGAFRAKSYGFEYRVPSTAWLASTDLQGWVFDASLKAVTDYFDGDRPAELFGDQARTIIDQNMTDWQQRFSFGTDLILPYQQAA